MKKLLFSLTILPLSIFAITSSFAGNQPDHFTFSVQEAYYQFSSQRHLDNTGMPNIGLAYNLSDKLAIEGSVGLINTTQKDSIGDKGVHGFLYLVDGIYRFTPYQHLEPYALLGVGVLGLKPNHNDPEQEGNINAGVGAQYFLTNNFSLRAELRDLYNVTGGGKNDFMANVGISILLANKN